MGHNGGNDVDASPGGGRRDSTPRPEDAHLEQVALVDDPLFDQHWAPEYRGHPERPERLAASRAGLADLGAHRNAALMRLPARDASLEELGLVHDPRYLESLEAAAGRKGQLDEDTYYGPRSIDAARRAAGGALSLVDTLLAGRARRGLALLRPPGHHARPSGAMGFCLLNNAALAAARALERGARRVAVVDWDVHHGNGTEEAFYADPRVLYISLHQWPFYPGTGAATDAGAGEGRGFNVNVPLSAGATPEIYRAAFDSVVLPILAEYAPDLILVSAGYDAHERDPLGSMKLDDASYEAMTHALLEVGGGVPLGVLLEGGYDLLALQGAIATTCEALLSSQRAGARATPAPSPSKSALHEAELSRVRRVQSAYWRI